MAAKDEKLLQELHETLMKEFMEQIGESIDNIQGNPDTAKNDSGSASTNESLAPTQEQHYGPDKINEIRNEVATTPSAAILNPDKQSELMEIVRQKSEAFDHELHSLVSSNTSADSYTIESAAQRFKGELMNNFRKQLTERNYALAH